MNFSIIYQIILALTVFFYSNTLLAEEKPVQAYPNSVARGLKAFLLEDHRSIRLEWLPPKQTGEIIIARSSKRIDTPEKLFISDSLGRYKSDPNNNPYISHEDLNLKPGKYYFAVILRKDVKKRTVKLIPGVNYTLEPVIVRQTEKQQVDQFHYIRQITAKLTKDHLILHWLAPKQVDANNTSYNLYQSHQPPSTNIALQRAKLVEKFKHPTTSYQIPLSQLKERFLYFGITVTVNGFESRPLISNQSFVRIEIPEKKVIEKPVAIIPKKNAKTTSSLVNNLDKEIIPERLTLRWSPPQNALLKQTVYHIYQFQKPQQDDSKETPVKPEKARKLASVYHPQTLYQWQKPVIDKPCYFAVTVQNDKEFENKTLKAKQNMIFFTEKDLAGLQKPKPIIKPPVDKKEPVQPMKKKIEKPTEKIAEAAQKEPEPVKKVEPPKYDPGHEQDAIIKPEPPEKPKQPKKEIDEFQQIMDSTYKKRKFSAAIEKLGAYVEKQKDPKKKAEGLFYQALSHFWQKNYDKALQLLLSNELQLHYDKQRVDFYSKRCIENRGKSNE